MGVTNTSAHLRVLREARLVDTRKEGTRVFYRLACEEVCEFFFSLRELASDRFAEVDQVTRDYFEARDQLDPLSRADLMARAVDRDVMRVLDHIPNVASRRSLSRSQAVENRYDDETRWWSKRRQSLGVGQNHSAK